MSTSTAHLLALWENSHHAGATAQALALAHAAEPDSSRAELAEWPLGRRDRLLFLLRKKLFGNSMTLLLNCPQCGELIEFDMLADDFLQVVEGGDSQSFAIEFDEQEISFRLPNSRDMAWIASLPAADRTEDALMKRCLLGPPEDGDRTVTEALKARIVEEMSTLDPLADINLQVNCAACEHHWMAALDIGSYLWQELNDWAGRLFQDIDLLARRYGWREEDIVALSPLRRRLYVEMALSD